MFSIKRMPKKEASPSLLALLRRLALSVVSANARDRIRHEGFNPRCEPWAVFGVHEFFGKKAMMVDQITVRGLQNPYNMI
jgi:hypothetical protein